MKDMVLVFILVGTLHTSAFAKEKLVDSEPLFAEPSILRLLCKVGQKLVCMPGHCPHGAIGCGTDGNLPEPSCFCADIPQVLVQSEE